MTAYAEKIEVYLKDTLGIPVESHATPLVSAGLIDSMQVVEIATFLESSADILLDESDLIVENFDSVEAMAALVAAKT